ncbi:hypothetical protein PLICRDRAFT_95362 [Plicaturopsis crispa FD-325 SS-3]|uniref:Reverse transcriptase domain-containing protein n=1 Tax=Plicaturopsis crispa FD-325 SS-3 TaxID=944288 RepID=A0A0C9SKV4_PLICR|nr:hypothetical protein PLICRDRAFT_95362 [Plicaturopsis crispa FD-325 SS-3]
MSHGIFSLDSRVGSLPPFEGRQLYMARVDPHLTFGCEVILDVDRTLVRQLEAAQNMYLRRLIGLSPRSMVRVLFTETGTLPIGFRRVSLAVRYLQYLVNLTPNRFAHSALMDSVALATAGKAGWLTDLRLVLSRLPTPVALLDTDLCQDRLPSVLEAIEDSAEKWLQDFIQTSTKTFLLRNRLERDDEGALVTKVMAFRRYLRIPNPTHRKALTQLMLGGTKLGVERLRYPERYRDRVPWEHRVCRFCRMGVEDECHALFICPANMDLRRARERFVERMRATLPGYIEWAQAGTAFVHEILTVYDTKELWVPYEYRIIEGL